MNALVFAPVPPAAVTETVTAPAEPAGVRAVIEVDEFTVNDASTPPK